jgi:hypothetical protein
MLVRALVPDAERFRSSNTSFDQRWFTDALSKVLKISMLPLDGRSPRIACFKVLGSFVRQYSSAMPVYVQDWIQMASHTVQ